MNEQVDNQIVSLQFDNKNFEKNTKTSMKTLDKLKAKLNFKGAAKGLQDIEDASKKVRFETLANSIDTVKNKFSALEVMGITALANLTNSAVNYGKRIVSALTIDPVNTGFSEYETKMGSIQTILANTSSKGKKLEDVTKVLNELNTYADKTIYNFAEMTRNIGTFTAAGVDLEVAAAAIQGIANIAAVSGSTSQQASVAMYQLSQAISSGTVRLQDWNSVVNAGMGGEKFQNALIATAREMARTTSTYAYNVDELLIKNGSFRESLREGWLTADVLNQTLKKFTVEGAKEYGQKMMDLGEWTQETADSLVAMAQEMEDAATKVKTFSQLWDTLKEAAQSGWAQTWEIIIGDFDQAKTFLTYISDTVSGMIGRSADKRNTFLGIALNPVSTFNSLIQNAGLNLNYFQEKIKETAKKNEIAIDSLIKEHGSLSNVISEGILPTNIFVEALESLTEEELRSAGYTKYQIEAIQQLGVEAKKTGSSLNNAITAMGQRSGWSLMFDSIKKIVNYIGEALSHVKKAWSDTFSPMQSSALYSFVKRINDFVSGLSVTDETANKLYRTAKGIAAIFDIIFSTVKGGWRLMSRFVSEILGVADVDLLELTARIGDLIVKFRDWLKSVINLKGILDKLSPIIRRLGQFIKQAGQIIANFLDTLRNSDNVPRDIILGLVNGLKDGIPLIVRSVMDLGKTILLTLKDVLGIHSPSTEMFAIGKWIILGLFNGLKEFAKLIWSYLVKFAGGFKVGFSAIIDGAKSVFNGLKPILSSLYNILKTAVNKILSILGELDFNKVMSIGIAGGSLAFMYKIATALVSFGRAAENFSKPLSRLKDVFESISKDIKKLTKAFTTRINIKAVKDLATAIAILAGAIAVLALIPDKDRVDSAIGTILILAGAVAGLSFVATEMAKVEAVYGNGSTLKASGAIAAISASVLMLAGALAKLGSIEPSKLKQATLTLVIMVETLTILMLIVALITKNTHVDEEVHKLGLTLMGVAVALLIFTKVITYVAKASQTANLAAALGLITYMSILLGGIALISTYYSHYSKGMARMLAGFTVDLVLMLGVIKIAASMQTRTLLKGIVAVRLLEVIMIQLIRVSHMYNKDSEGLVGSMLGIGAALLAMAVSVKMISGLDDEALKKGLISITVFSGIVIGLIAATRLAGDKELKRMMSTLTGMSVCIGMMTIATFALQFLKLPNIAKGIAAVSMLAAMVSLMVRSTKDSTNPSKSIYALVVAIGALTASLAILSAIPTGSLFKAVGAISVVLSAFSLLVYSTSKIKENKILGQLWSLTAIVVILSGLLFVINKLDIQPAIGTCTLLVGLLLAMSSVMLILSHMKRNVSTDTISQLGVMTVIVSALYAMVKLASSLTNTEPTVDSILGITVLLNAMAAAMLVLSNIKNNISTTTISQLGVMTVIVSALYAMVKLASDVTNTEPVIKTILGITVLLGAMTSMMLILSHMKNDVSTDTISQLGVMTVIVSALYAMVKLASSITNTEPSFKTILGLTVLLMGMASVMSTLSKLKHEISKDTMLQLAQLAVIVSLLYGLTKAASVIPATGPEFDALYGLSKIMKALATTLWILSTIKGDIKSSLIVQLGILAGIVSGFFAIMKAASMIPSSFSNAPLDNFKGIGLLITAAASALLILSKAKNKINASSLVALGIISAVLVGLVYVISLIPNSSELGIDITAATAIGVVLLALCSSVLILAKFPKGSFVTALEAIGIVAVLILALGAVLGALGWLGNKAFGNDLENTLNAGVLIFTKIGEAVGGLVTGGFKAMANVVIDTLNGLAGCLQNFIAALNTINPESMKGFKYLAETILILTAADVLNGIDLFSVQKFQRFGEQIKAFGDPIVEFANTVNEKTTKEALEAAKNAASILIVLSAIAPRSGGWIDAIFGSNDLDKFGNQIESFGDAVVRFSNKVAGKVNKDAFNAAKEAGKIMVELQKSVPETGGVIDTICGYSDLTTFGTNIENFGSAIVRFSNTVSGKTDAGKLDQDAVKKAKAAGDIMASLQKSIPDSGGFIGWLNGQRGLGNFGDNIEKFGEGITAFATSVSETTIDLAKIQTAADAGGIMVDLLNKLPDRQTYSLAGLREGITSAGGLLLQFNNQMNALDVDRTKKAADSIKSLALVVTNLSNLDTSKTNVSLIKEIIGSTVKTLISSADEINRAINEGMEIKPVVKPVLDLSNVRQGASLIPSMLNTQPALGTLSNVGYISANMNRNSQNGNGDVVAAIDKLRESLGDIGNDTYNINGITYNDDSAIADAIKTIIRAINIERRS